MYELLVFSFCTKIIKHIRKLMKLKINNKLCVPIGKSL